MRGRHPSGPGFVAKLKGSEQAKQRVQVVLETLAGLRRVSEACALLGISEPRFDQLRIEMLQAGVERLEPQPAGRPARAATPAEAENQRLQARIAALQAELQVANVRAEIALTLPQVGDTAGKKTPAPTPRTKKPTGNSSVN